MRTINRQRRTLAWLATSLVAVAASAARATGQPGPDPRRFEAEVAQFEAADRATPPPEGAVLFVGSSSIP
jgi:hypothetical protein